MAIISYGRVDKKLILVFFITVVNILNLILTKKYSNEYSNDYLYNLLEEVGPIIVGLTLHFILKQKPESKNRKSIKYLILLFFLKGVKACGDILYGYFTEDPKYDLDNLLNTTNGIGIILMSVGTYIILRYKYYIHHYISMIIYCVLGITCDFVLKTFFELSYDYTYLFIAYIINDVLIFCYIKYMMDVLYYQYTEVVIYWGITGLLSKLLIYTSLSIHEYANNIEGTLYNINIYFTETNILVIIFFQFFYFIFIKGVYYLLIILMVFYLKPNHTIITDEILVYTRFIFYDENKENKYYTIIPFVFQILALFFYFEILECNFCELNKNTIKNIQDREHKENQPQKKDVNLIEIGDYYIKEIKDNSSLNSDDNSENIINK